jgi:hypothetical protein
MTEWRICNRGIQLTCLKFTSFGEGQKDAPFNKLNYV